MIKKLILAVIFIKVSIFLVIFLAYFLLPFNTNNYSVNLSYPINEKITLQTAFKTWDAQHYLFLSQNGYQKNNLSDRFFPLLPLSIALVNLIIRNPVLSGLIISNVFSVIGAYYFFLFARLLLKNEKGAVLSLLLLFAFPTAFYLSLIYSESLLFFLISAFFYYLYSKKYFLAAVFSFFIPFVRPVGILIEGPYLIYWGLMIWENSKRDFRMFVKSLFTTKASYYLLIPILGFAVYLGFMQIATGYFFEGFKAQTMVISGWNLSNLLDPVYLLVNLFLPASLAIHGFTNSIIDRLFFISYLVGLFFVYKRLDKTMFVYSLLFGMVPILGSFMSYTRYVLMVFPIFIVAAKMLEEKKEQLLNYSVFTLMVMLQTLFIVMHALNYWVA